MAMDVERLPDMMRILNIIENYTDKQGQEKDPLTGEMVDKFRQFTIEDASFENGQVGKKVIGFTNKDMTPQESTDLMKWEDSQAALGKPIRVRKINIKSIKEIPLKWFIAVTGKERDSTALQQTMFRELVQDAAMVAQMSGQQINGSKMTEEFQRRWKIKDLFQQQAPQGMPGQPGQPPGQPGQGGVPQQAQALMQQMQGGQPQQPSVNQQVQQPG